MVLLMLLRPQLYPVPELHQRLKYPGGGMVPHAAEGVAEVKGAAVDVEILIATVEQ